MCTLRDFTNWWVRSASNVTHQPASSVWDNRLQTCCEANAWPLEGNLLCNRVWLASQIQPWTPAEVLNESFSFHHKLYLIPCQGPAGDLLLPHRDTHTHIHNIIHHHCKCFFTFKLYTHWQSKELKRSLFCSNEVAPTIPLGFVANEVQSQALTQNTCANVQLRGTSPLLSAMEHSRATCRQWIYCSISCGWGLLECFYLFVAVQRCMGSKH